jgi:hypothetical protein
VVEALIHAIAKLPRGSLHDFTKAQLFKSVLRQEDLAWVVTTIFSAPLSPQSLASLDSIEFIIRRHPGLDIHQCFQIMQTAEQNLQQIYGPSSYLEQVAHRKLVDSYLEQLIQLKKGLELEAQVIFYALVQGGTYYDGLEYVVFLP